MGEETHTKTEKKVGGGEVKTTTYNYRKEWSERPIDSGRFRHPEGHRNPGIMPYRSQTLTAEGVTLGAFKLSSQQVAQVDAFQPLALSKDNHQPPADLKAQSQESGLYLGQNSADPQVGDQKISFQVVPLTTLSVVGVQKGSSLAPFEAKAGDSIMMVWAGEHTATAMFKQAQSSNHTLDLGAAPGGFGVDGASAWAWCCAPSRWCWTCCPSWATSPGPGWASSPFSWASPSPWW